MGIIITLFLYLFLFIINTLFFKTYKNFLNLIISAILITLMIANIGFYGFQPPSIKTNLFLNTSILCFDFFTLFFVSIKIKEVTNEIPKEKISYFKINIVAVIICVLMIPSAIIGLNYIINNGYGALRNAYLLDLVYSNYTKLLLVYILVPLNKGLFIYGVLDYFENKKVRLFLVVSIINIIQNVLIFAGRSVLMESFLYLLIVVLYYNRNRIFKVLKKNKKIVLLVIITIIFMLIITNNRNLIRGGSFLLNLYSYFCGSMHIIDYHIRNVNFSLLDGSHLLYGKIVLSPFFDTIKLFLNIFGIENSIRTGTEIINNQVQQYIQFNNNISLNNNVTYLYVCLRDFGTLGLIIGPLYLSLLYSIVYKKFVYYKSIKNKALYFYMISVVPYLILEFYFNRTGTIYTIIFILLIGKLFVKEEKK